MRSNFLLLVICFSNNFFGQTPLNYPFPEKPVANAFGNVDENISNFTGRIFYLPDNAKKLPDFDHLSSEGTIFAKSLNIENQKFYKGFPGITKRFENFAIEYKGQFYLSSDIDFIFQLSSDDGSKLFIDDKLIIDNDLLHRIVSKENEVSLKKGMHTIEVQYFQGPKDEVALLLKYKIEKDGVFKIFDLSDFSNIAINDTSDAIAVSIGNEVLFDTNSFQLNDKAKYALEEVKRLIIDKTQLRSILIEGHTDDIGSEIYNKSLSSKRADAVKTYFTRLGISSSLIFTKGLGETKPKLSNTDEESRKENRRIELIITK